MAGLATLPNILTLASTVAGVGQTIAQANIQDIASKRHAEQLQIQQIETKKKATEEMAIATHEAEQKRRHAEKVKSRARAVAAASGAGGYDPYELEAEGDYHVLTALYNGEIRSALSKSRGLNLRLKEAATRTRGIYDRYNTYARGVKTFADRAETLYSRYG